MATSRRIRTVFRAAVVAVTVVGAVSAVQLVAAAPSPGQVGTATLGLAGWQVQSSGVVTQPGSAVSLPGFSTTGWLPVQPDDAGAPGTEVESLLQNGICPGDPGLHVNQSDGGPGSVFYADNLKTCFGYQSRRGAIMTPQFAVPWWFRTDFTSHLAPGQHATLVVNGVVGQADVWVDGTEVATQATMQGDYASYRFDVTDLLRAGTNSVAFEVYPNNPTTMFTTDSVDWSQIAPDNNTGIQFPVQLHVFDAISVDNAYVTEDDAPNLSHATVTVHADVSNASGTTDGTTVVATITRPDGRTMRLTRDVTVAAHSTRTITLTQQLEHPAVWWPYQMGAQPLYRLDVSVPTSDVAPSTTFAIRTITTHLTPPSNMAPDGVRVFAVNGVPFQFRGGGWSENLFLHYSASDLANQIVLIKNLGLNGIRTEGKEMPTDFYEQMDRAGILIDAGFQCCDKWEPPSSGRGVTARDFQVIYESALTIGKRLRDHPSIMNYSWSDNAPIPEQEAVTLQGFAAAGFQEPIISSAEYNTSGILGPAGEKEGPYDWVPPAYWYDTTHASNTGIDNDNTLTNVGGAWGFDSEQSAGDTVPTVDSINRFLSPADQAALWQQPDAHQYHTNYESLDGEHVGYSFGTLANLDQAITQRYGQWSGLAQYVEEAQAQNYEVTRAQFEAFLDHWNNYPTPATGTDYWQLNKGMPTLLWDLYNYDYDQAGAYFGVKKANESLHVLYAYDDGTVAVDNLTGQRQSGLSVEATVRDVSGAVLDRQVSAPLTLTAQGVANRVVTPHVPATTTPPTPAQTYFVELQLRQGGRIIDRNVYWLSTQQDVVDWADTEGNPQALTSPTTAGLPQWADMRSLQSLPAAQVAVSAGTQHAGGHAATTVTITNTSPHTAVAFLLRADVRRGQPDGTPLPGDNQVRPVAWSDNDVTLWPGESQTITATYDASLLGGATPVVSVSGWNVAGRAIAATGTPAAATATAEPAAAVASPAAPDHPVWKISQSATPTQFTQGDAADSYAITLSNTGNHPAAGVTLTDVIDPGLSLTGASGSGWTCDTDNDPTVVCQQSTTLPPGASYPPLTVTVAVPDLAGFGSQDSTAGLHVTNAVTVPGAPPSTVETPIVGRPFLIADDALASTFHQGDTADAYQITVINEGAAATDPAQPIVVDVSVPGGETAQAMYGSGWTCSLTSCSRSAALPGENGEAPPITLLVSVAPDAPASVTQRVTVSGGGEAITARTATAATTVAPTSAQAAPPGPLTITSRHNGGFVQGDTGDRYTLSVSATAPAVGTVTVTDTLPPGLTPTRMTGPGWTCTLASCTRDDPLPAGGSYPPITLSVSVAGDTQPAVTNVATVSGGAGSTPAQATATDPTTITQRADLTLTGLTSSDGVPYAPFDRAGTYGFTVSNVGFAPTDEPVTLSVDLPGVARVVSISGAGWMCAGLTCRHDASIAAGGASTVTLRDALPPAAPSDVVTMADVSGGGEINPGNDAYIAFSYVR